MAARTNGRRLVRGSWMAASVALAVGAAGSVSAQALHLDIAVQENLSDGRLSVHGFDWNTLPEDGILVDQRAFVRAVGLSGGYKLTDDPGFVSRIAANELDPVALTTVAGSEPLLFNVLSPPLSTMAALGGRTVSYWDGSLPVVWGPTPDADEGIEIYQGSFSNPTDQLVLVGETTDQEGFVIAGATSGGSLHEHVSFLLHPDNALPSGAGPDNGVYAMLLELMYGSYSEWIPVFIGLESFTGGGDPIRIAAQDDLTANFVFPLCSDGIDNDKDGAIDLADDGCTDASDMSERGAVSECDNGIDDDMDGFVDFHDLDGNGTVDGPGDASCLHRTNPRETVPEPGFGAGLFVGVALLARATRRSGHAAGPC